MCPVEARAVVDLMVPGAVRKSAFAPVVAFGQVKPKGPGVVACKGVAYGKPECGRGGMAGGGLMSSGQTLSCEAIQSGWLLPSGGWVRAYSCTKDGQRSVLRTAFHSCTHIAKASFRVWSFW